MSQESFVNNIEEEVLVLLEAEDLESSEEPPQEEWSSLLCFLQMPDLTDKQRLFEEGLYTPPSEEICAKYIPLSDSSVFRHPYYKYPCVQDPGIEEALLHSPRRITYADDGQELYLALCKEMNEAYSRIFYKQLLEEHMNMSYYGISSYGWRPMAMALKENKIVKSVDFVSNYITYDGCYHLGDMLLDNFTITELNFSGCRMGPDGIKRLVVNFPKNNTLRKIDLSKNKLTDDGMAHLCDVLYLGSSVTNINVSYNGLTSKTATNLATAIEFVNKITHLDLSLNSFTVPKPVEVLVSRFLENDTLVEVNFAWNSLSNRFAKPLSNLLLCKNIRVINLSNNNLTGEVITEIGANLKVAKNLQVLDMSFNPMTTAEARLLAGYMRFKAVKLKKLYMDNVNVDEPFMRFRDRILGMKFRKDSEITHGYVTRKLMTTPFDIRKLVLRRAQVVCSKPKKKQIDVGLMILRLHKEKLGAPIFLEEFIRFVKMYGAFQINKDLATEMGAAFPGPRAGKFRLVNVEAMANYVLRMWPDKKLPPTPPPRPPPPPIAPTRKGKQAKAPEKGKKGKK